MCIYIIICIYSIVEEQLIDDTYFCYSEFRANALVSQSQSDACLTSALARSSE